MRKPTDPCLLCLINLATKTKSHIYPKFISTNFLGPKGTPRRGFSLSSETQSRQKPPEVIQDSPKEDYILCEECEAFFSVLEGIASDVFANWRTKVASGEYIQKSIIDDMDIVECNSADKRTIHLFVYSIFWRVSVSEIELFENARLEKGFEEELRLLLMAYRYSKRIDYSTSLEAAPNFRFFPNTILTAKSFKDETANLLFAPFSSNPYCLVVDRFAFMLYRVPTDMKVDFIRNLSNNALNDCRMMVFSEQLWHDTIVKRPLELLAKKLGKQAKS